MKTTANRSVAIVAVLALTAIAQIASADPVIPPDKLNAKSNDIPTWSPDTTMQLYVGDEMYNAMDGGATDFINRGCISAGIQTFTRPDSAKVRSIVMDFGTSDKAKAMFLWAKGRYGLNAQYIISYPPFSDSVVCVDTSFLFSVECLAHFDNLYLQIDIIGVPWVSSLDSLVPVLNAFLGFYIQRIEEYEASALLNSCRLESGRQIGGEEISVTRGRAGNDFIISARSPEPVLVRIFDSSGHEIASLVNKTFASAPHSLIWNTRNIVSGRYTVRVQAGSNTFVKSIPIVRR